MAERAKPVVFEMDLGRIVVDEDSWTMDLDHPDTPNVERGQNIPDEHLQKQRAWFAGLNDEFGGGEGGIRIAVYGHELNGFKPGQRVRITVEAIDG